MRLRGRLAVRAGMLMLAAGFGVAAVVASGADVFNAGDQHEGVGQADVMDLKPGTVYTASAFPLGVRLRAPDVLWGGVQLRSGAFRFVQLAHHHRTGDPPLQGTGYVTLESSTSPTPSVEATVRRLHTTPHMDAGPIISMRVGRIVGKGFDATITGRDNPPYCHTHPCSAGVSLAPFTKNRHCGFCTNTMHGETLDVKYAGTGERFRIIVIGVHRKSVVIYLEANYADQPKFPPTKIFPTFLPQAQKMLAAISFS